MDVILNDFSAQALTAAIEANLLKYYRYIGRSDYVELNDTPDLTRFITGIPHPFLNVIFCKHLKSLDAIEETVKLLKSHKVPFLCWIGSAAQSVDWGTKLQGCGLAYDKDYACMAADLLELNEEFIPPANLNIEPVRDKKALSHWVNSALIGFGLPIKSDKVCFDLFVGLGFDVALRNYLGLLDGKPVATSQLFLAAGVAGIYWVTTIPEARRQGIGMAMTLAPLRDARAMGYRISVLHPSDMGRGVYRRLGFEDSGKLSHGLWIEKA
jgi:GNAT superfamily N-acetyltransferase